MMRVNTDAMAGIVDHCDAATTLTAVGSERAEPDNSANRTGAGGPRGERGGGRTPIFDRDGTATGSDDILTVPNAFTLARLFCIPLFLWLVHGADRWYAAAWLLGVLGMTDWVDGYLARLLDQRSKFGQVFDPTVDRLMFVVAIISMLIVGAAPAWFLIAVLFREVAVSLAAVAIATRGVRTVQVSWWGKTATFGLLFALPLFLAAAAEPPGEQVYRLLAWVIGLPALVLSWVSAIGYLPVLTTAFSGPTETG